MQVRKMVAVAAAGMFVVCGTGVASGFDVKGIAESSFSGIRGAQKVSPTAIVVDKKIVDNNSFDKLMDAAESQGIDTFYVKNNVVSGEEQRRLDEQANADAVEASGIQEIDSNEDLLCDGALPYKRSETGAFAHFDCNTETGDVEIVEMNQGTVAESLDLALTSVLSKHIGENVTVDVQVDIISDTLVVDFSPESLSGVDKEDGFAMGLLRQALGDTALSNESIDYATFNIEGDCLRFAEAIGGDSCLTSENEGR